MNLGEVLEKAGIKANDFENVEDVDTNLIQLEQKIDFLQRWDKMLQRGASEKEKYHFATQNGYISVQHLSLCLTLEDKIAEKETALRDYKEDMNDYGYDKEIELEISRLEKDINVLKRHLENVKTVSRYVFTMRVYNLPDINPYGVDVCRNKSAKEAMKIINS